jgi:hypothetical protein
METEEREFADDEARKQEKAVTSTAASGEEIPYDEKFSFDGYQVVRGEFFAHINEPTITFNNNKVSVNMACIKRLSEVEYVQILVHQEERKLVVRPSSEDEKESFVWCSRGAKRAPKQVTCRVFFAKIMKLTGWNPDNRYKLLGKIFRSGDEILFIFDLDSRQIFPRVKNDSGEYRVSRAPVLPIEWEKPFGPTVEEHLKQMQAKVFKGYTVFSVTDRKTTDDPTVAATTIIKPQGDKGDA